MKTILGFGLLNILVHANLFEPISMASTVPDKAMPILIDDKEFAQKKIKKVECIEKADEVNAKYKKKAAKADTDFNTKVKGDRARKEKAVAEKTKAEGIYDGI